MIQNATLIRIDAPPAPAGGGDLAAYVPGSGAVLPSAGVRCCLEAPTFVIQRLLDQMKLESTAVLYVDLAALPSGPAVLLRNSQVQVQQDGSAAIAMRIDFARVMSNASVSHVQCFLRVA